MDCFQQRYYRLNKIIIYGVGQWPYQTTSSRILCLGITLFLSCFHVFAQIMGGLTNLDNMSIFIDCLVPFLFDCAIVAKLTTCAFCMKKMEILLDQIRVDWGVWANEEEVEILHEYAEKGRKFTFVYMSVGYLTAIFYVSESVVPKVYDTLFKNNTAPFEYPLPLNYGSLDMDKYYYPIIGYTYVAIIAICSLSIAWDLLFITIAAHVCGIFAAVGHRLKRADQGLSADSIDNEKESTAVYQHLSTCIDRHNDAIEYGTLLDETYRWCFLFIVGINMIMISITILQIVTSLDTGKSLFRFIGFAVLQLTHLYIDNNISQYLIDLSTNISHDVFSGEWYKLPLKSQKLLGLIAMRANVPCKLTAGKICDLNVSTFGVIVKTSMSYFTILRSMQ